MAIYIVDVKSEMKEKQEFMFIYIYMTLSQGDNKFTIIGHQYLCKIV